MTNVSKNGENSDSGRRLEKQCITHVEAFLKYTLLDINISSVLIDISLDIKAGYNT